MGVYLSEPNTNKETTSGEGKYLRYATCEMQGWRKNMQDAKIVKVDHKIDNNNYCIFGVFDGHGGTEVSKFCEENFIPELLKQQKFLEGKIAQSLQANFRRMDQLLDSQQGNKKLREIKKKMNGENSYSNDNSQINAGCTANVLVIDDNNYYIANAGDSRCALSREGKLITLSEDHKPQSKIEKDRIQNAGGAIINGRVNGGLNLTRAIGDFEYKRTTGLDYKSQMITCHPDVKIVPRSPKDEFIIMGCDGIWQKYVNDSQALLNHIAQKKKSQTDLAKLLQNLLDFLLAKNTMQEVGCDNMTSVIIEFK